MKEITISLFITLLLIPLVASALEPTSPGIRANRQDETASTGNPLADSQRSLTIDFWHQSPTSSLGLVDAITGAVSWQPVQEFRTGGLSDTLFPCRFTFRCSIGNRITKYCKVMTDNRASYRMQIDVNGLVYVSVDGPGRQSVSFEAEGLRKRILVYGRTDANGSWCGIEP